MADPMMLIVASGHPAARKAVVDLREFAEEPWIAGSPASPGTHMTLRACRRAGFEPDIRMRTEDYLVMRRLVATGAGVAFVPQLALLDPVERFAVCSLSDNQLVRRVFTARRTSCDAPSAVSAMEYELREVARKFTTAR